MRVRALRISIGILGISSAAWAGDLQPYHAQEIQPVHAHTIQPVKAHEIAPVHSHELQAVHAHELTPVRSHTIQSAPSHPAAPAAPGSTPGVYHAHVLTPSRPAGVDPVQSPGPIDRRVVGHWRLAIPSVSWTTRTHDGNTRVDTTHSGVGAGMGLLTIHRNGTYRWEHAGRRAYGKLAEVVPHNFAQPGLRYWLIRDGNEMYYLAPVKNGLELYSPGTNLYAATGTAER